MDTFLTFIKRDRSNTANSVQNSPKAESQTDAHTRRSINIEPSSKEKDVIPTRRLSDTVIINHTVSVKSIPLKKSSELNKPLNQKIKPLRTLDGKNKMVVVKKETLSDRVYNYFILFIGILIYHKIYYHQVKSFTITGQYEITETLTLSELIELKNKVKEHIRQEYRDVYCECELATYLSNNKNTYTLTLFDLFCYG